MAIRSRDVMNWVSTVVVLLAAIDGGMNMGIFNPTLPDITILMSATTTETSSTLAAVGLMSMAGAFLFGPLFDRFNGLSVLSAALLFQGLSLGLAPWCPNIIGYQVCAAIMAFFNFGVLTGVFATNCRTWQSRTEMIAPIIQLTDMVHVLGVAITPQVVAPFVGHLKPVPDANDTSPSIGNSSQLPLNVTDARHHTQVQPIQKAYVIVAAIDVVIAAVCFVVYVIDAVYARRRRRSEMRRSSRRRSYSLNVEEIRRVASQQALAACMKSRRAGSVEREKTHVFGGIKSELVAVCPEATIIRTEENTVPPLTCSCSMVTLVTCLFIFFVALGGREMMMTGLLFTYLLTTLGWPATVGTMLVTVYHVARVLLHAVVIATARWVSPFKLSVFNLVIQLIASCFGLVVDTPFVITAILLGAVATSNIVPTAITLARMSFQVGGKAMGIFIGAVACGQCIMAPVVGRILERPGDGLGFPFALVILSVIAIIFFVPWVAIAKVLRKKTDATSSFDTAEVKFTISRRRSSVKPTTDGNPDEKTPLIE